MSNTQKITNSLLVQQCQNGHKKSYVFLVKKWHKVFCNTAYFYVKDAAMAKDIAQDSRVIIMNKIATLKHPSAFSSWALQIVKRQALDTIKREQKYNKRQLKQEDVATQEESGLNDNHLTLHTTIKKLPYK